MCIYILSNYTSTTVFSQYKDLFIKMSTVSNNIHKVFIILIYLFVIENMHGYKKLPYIYIYIYIYVNKFKKYILLCYPYF